MNEPAPIEVAVITTTINVPTALEDLATRSPGRYALHVVVAGDVQTPPETREFVENLGGTYLGVADDVTTRWESHDVIGYRSIQRRNLALLHALTLGPDVVITIDDDNEPHDPRTYVETFVTGLLRDAPDSLTQTDTDWYNPGVVLEPSVVHRGFPLDQRHREHVVDRVTTHERYPPRVGVVAGLWTGDPDVDAVDRIANAPHVRGFRGQPGHRDVVLARATWAPFNTQNTAYRWEVAPLMQCLVGVGRYDDIWMSYVARAVLDHLGWHVRYGNPLVTQARNQHDLVHDLRLELMGYHHTPELVAQLRRLDLELLGESTSVELLDYLAHCYAELDAVWPTYTSEANETWLRDAAIAVDEGTKQRRERGL